MDLVDGVRAPQLGPGYRGRRAAARCVLLGPRVPRPASQTESGYILHLVRGSGGTIAFYNITFENLVIMT